MAKRGRQSPEDRLLRQVALNYQHSRARLGKLRLQCEVSDRFLSLPESSDAFPDGRDLMFVDVMTRNVDGDVHKICELILDRHDITEALARVKSKPFRPRSGPQSA